MKRNQIKRKKANFCPTCFIHFDSPLNIPNAFTCNFHVQIFSIFPLENDIT